jgi:ABC-2 type transport system permease protein
MMTFKQLFTRRVYSDWRFQYRTIRTAVDWTVALYIVIPALLIAGYHYLSWWEAPPEWFAWIPYSVVLFICYLFAWSGTIRFFVEEGDQLFLRAKTSWFEPFMQLGWRYSFVIQGVTTLLLMVVLLPLLKHAYSFNGWDMLCLFALTYVFKMILGVGRQLISLHLHGFSLWASRIGVVLVSYIVYRLPVMQIPAYALLSWGSCLLLLAGLVVLGRLRLRQKSAFLADVAREREARMRIAALMLMGIIEKKRAPLRKRPFLFSGSRRVIRGRGSSKAMAELLVKAFIRNSSQWRLSLQFVAVVSVAMFLVPLPIGIVLWLTAAIMLAVWRKAFCKEVMTASFLTLFHYKKSDQHDAVRFATPLLMLPAFMVISLCLGIAMVVWWGPLLMLAAAVAAAYLFSSIVTSWY